MAVLGAMCPPYQRWIVNLAYRPSVWNWAAQTFVATSSTPETFLAWRRFAGMLLAVFSLVGYAAVALLGLALLRSGTGPGWLRIATLVCGLSAGFVFGYNVPFVMYTPFVALGIALLAST